MYVFSATMFILAHTYIAYNIFHFQRGGGANCPKKLCYQIPAKVAILVNFCVPGTE